MFKIDETWMAIISSILIPLIIGWITYLVAKKQIINTGVTQFRQKWIDDLRASISIFIAKSEMIAMLEFEEDDLYLKYFEELSREHSKIELMLNPNEANHNELIKQTEIIRELIHRDMKNQKTFDKLLDNKIKKLLEISKKVLKEEWVVVKKGK